MEDTPRRHARRAALYGYAAAALQYPDEAVVADVRDDEVRAAVREAADALGVGDALAPLVGAVADAERDELASEYNDLFGLPTDDGTYPVVPYEAHYTTDDDVSDSQRRIATVVGLLEEFGLQPGTSFDERQDHVAVELELMQVVAGQRAVALAEGDADVADRLAAAEATILDEHLSGFVPALAHDVAETGGSAVYAAAASFAASLVERDVAGHPEPHDTATAEREVSRSD